MMIDRTFVAEEQNILNRLREQEAKVNGKLYMYFLLSLTQYNIIIKINIACIYGFVSSEITFFNLLHFYLFHIL